MSMINSTQASRILRGHDQRLFSGTLSRSQYKVISGVKKEIESAMEQRGYLQCTNVREITGRPCVNILSKKFSEKYIEYRAFDNDPNKLKRGIRCRRCGEEWKHDKFTAKFSFPAPTEEDFK